jgi:SAM-dependent methyltransferase
MDEETAIRYRRAIEGLEFHSGSVIREVGCKFAILRDILLESNSRVDYKAMDIDRTVLERIPGYNPDTFLCGNADHGIPFPDATADYFICLEVMEHLENASAFLAEAARILKPGGTAVISVPNPYYWGEIVGNMRKIADTEGHVQSFTYQNIDAHLKFSGKFELKEVTGTYMQIPFSRRILGRYAIVEADGLFFTRSYIYKLRKH